jgi:hypothetical protein
MEFEEARDKWLKKLNGRTPIEYAADLEEEEDAKVAKNMTPEYLKIWENAAKEADAEGG